jgi:mRNA interferase RelE/StbE
LAWTIRYSDTARKQLRKLDKQAARRILDFMDSHIAGARNPRDTGKALTGPMLGSFWRYRVGDYRIICEIEDAKLCVLVIEIGHRREVYR